MMEYTRAELSDMLSRLNNYFGLSVSLLATIFLLTPTKIRDLIKEGGNEINEAK